MPATAERARERRARFRALHAADGVFVMPNPWDIGSAKLLASAGFTALATTSAGLAWSLGKNDQSVTRDELITHVRSIADATDLPLNADSERCYADDLPDIVETLEMLSDAGAAGCSIEDYDPASEAIDPLDVATERVAAAASVARRRHDGMVLTARCENFLYGITDLDDTIRRLRSYADAGAECVYAPGLHTVSQIRSVVDAVGVPVNVLAVPGGPSVAEIGNAGGRRVSIGGSLASAAYGALMTGARELLSTGTSEYSRSGLERTDRGAAFG